MLTTIASNPVTATTIKTHGSETRTAPGHNPVEGQSQPPAANVTIGVGLDAGMILANVNAEAATAGNRTILQTLALAVATQLNMARRADETMEAFFLRLAVALDDLPAKDRAALEARAGLKTLRVQLPDLSAALKQPEGTFAARLSAAAEAPLATPQKTAAAAATSTYLQEGAVAPRAAETLAMVTQSRNTSEGSGLFSTAGSTSTPAEQEQGDAKGLQTQLKSLFEPGVAETRIEIATRVEERNAVILGATDDNATPSTEPSATSAQAVVAEDAAPLAVDEEQSAKVGPGSQAKAEHWPEAKMQTHVAQNNNVPNAAARLRAIAREIAQEKVQHETRAAEKEAGGDHRMQTLLTLKGIAEVISAVPAKAVEFFMPLPETAGGKDKPNRFTHLPETEADNADSLLKAQADAARTKAGIAAHHSTASEASEDDEPDGRGKAPGHADRAEPQALAKSAENDKALLQKPVTIADVLPFAYAPLQPAKEEFRPEAPEERHAGQDDEDAEGGDGEPEDAEARRERLARKATDDLLRGDPEPAPQLTITRDSSEADRAYALYQRMGGF